MKQTYMTHICTRLVGVACLSTAISGCGGGVNSEVPVPKTYAAEIRRTSFGVPHVKADNEKGLGYGIGYAYAQDNFCLLAEAAVTNAGERSKYFGPTGMDSPYGGEDGDSRIDNLSSDFYYKSINGADQVDASWKAQSLELQDLLSGYAAGVNRYLSETGVAQLPDSCKSQPWVRSIDVLDLVRLMRRYSVLASGGLVPFMRAFNLAKPPSASVAAVGGKPNPQKMAALLAQMQPKVRSRFGSNGIALGKDATESGKGMLLANPHFPWQSVARFYQMHLTIPGKVDVMGASLGGLPVVNIGFNKDLAWTHTVNTSQHFTVFMVGLDPSDPTRYIVDGKSRPMTRRELSVESTTGGVSTTVKRTFFSTEYGPLMVMPGALEWTKGYAFSFADANLNNDRILKQWWALDKATSIQEFRNSVESIVGLGWVNVLAASREGTTYFGDVTPVPNVPTAKQEACIPEPFKQLASAGIFVLAGQMSACAWDIDPQAPQKGIFAGNRLPSIMRNDYVQNSNNSAWMTNAAQRLTGFPAIVSTESEELNGRTRSGLTLIANRLTSTDGLPGNRFTLKSLQSLSFSNDAFYAKSLLPQLRSLCITASPSYATACTVLQNWDGKASLTSVGWPLFQAWQAALAKGGISYWEIPFDPADPINTPRGLKTSDPAVRAAAMSALSDAVAQLTASGISMTKPWGQIQMASVGNTRIPIDGGGPLGGIEQTYNYQSSRPNPSKDGTLVPFWGSSVVLTVSFEGATPVAQGFLTYSQSADPKSRYASDQTARYSRKEWITYPFADESIKADPNLQSTTLSQ